MVQLEKKRKEELEKLERNGGGKTAS